MIAILLLAMLVFLLIGAAFIVTIGTIKIVLIVIAIILICNYALRGGRWY